MADNAQIEQLAEVAHDAYEAAAAGSGWQTQAASRKPWAEVPDANREATRAMIRAVLAAQRPATPAGDEAIQNTPEQVRAWTLGYLTGKRSAAPVAVDEATVAGVLEEAHRDHRPARIEWSDAHKAMTAWCSCGVALPDRGMDLATHFGLAGAIEVVRALAARDADGDDHG